MSCCGQKREAFRQETQTSSRAPGQNFNGFEPEPEKPPKVFEYTGDDHLILRGIGSGAVYHFRFKGEKLAVNFDDSFAMMGERDLKIA
jgi:hypothetical protein